MKKLSSLNLIIIIVLGIFAVFIITLLISVFATTSNKTTSNPSVSTNTATPKEEPKEPEFTYNEVTSWESAGNKWHAIVFSKRPNNDDLIKIAKELHSRNPNDNYDFFDDDEKLEEYKNWDINYAKVTDSTTYPYPEEWVNQHKIAVMNYMNNEGWQLTAGETYEKISDI